MNLESGILSGVSFDENFFEDEEPEEIKLFDLDGNEVTADVTE